MYYYLWIFFYSIGTGRGGETGACLRELIALKNIFPFTSIVVPIYLFYQRNMPGPVYCIYTSAYTFLQYMYIMYSLKQNGWLTLFKSDQRSILWLFCDSISKNLYTCQRVWKKVIIIFLSAILYRFGVREWQTCPWF